MKVTFGKLFRLIFVLFSLYLLGDAFYRWDGFSYYASFPEFLPGVALAAIIWTIVAAVSTAMIWLLLKVLGWFCDRIGWKTGAWDILIFAFLFLSLGAASWVVKRYLIEIGLTTQLKLLILICIAVAAFFLTRVLRDKVDRIFEGITPLVWLFSIIVILSVPLVAYETWIKDSGNASEEHSQVASSDKNRPNIILVTFDALSTYDMSLYGYKRDTTPFIKKWANNASVFTNAKSSDGYTTPTTASLMTGQRPWTHQTYHQRGKIRMGDIENIPRILKKNGYYAMSYIENKNASPISLNIFKGFNEYKSFVPEEQDILANINSWLYHVFFGKIKLYDWILLDDFVPTAIFKKVIYYPVYYQIYKKQVWENKRISPVSQVTILDKFISNIDNTPEPFFLWMHVMPPHEPYLPPEPFLGTFDKSSELRSLDQQFEYRQRLAKHIDDFGHLNKEDIELIDTYRARYDENILFCDKEFEEFIDQLRNKNKSDNTVIILSADHGESFEHNRIGHGGILYEQVMSIPLIIKYPDQSEGRVIDDIVEQIDIPATILDIANIPMTSWMEGRSVVPLIHNKTLPQKPAFAMHLVANRSGQEIKKGTLVVWEGNFKLLYNLEKGESTLFDLKKDPEEQINLMDKEAEEGKHLLGLIQNNLKKANDKILKGR